MLVRVLNGAGVVRLLLNSLAITQILGAKFSNL